MLLKEKTFEGYGEMTKALAPLGFVPHKTMPGYYSHKYIEGEDFDFTAHSIEGAPVAIFALGCLVGEKQAKKQIAKKFNDFQKSMGIVG